MHLKIPVVILTCALTGCSSQNSEKTVSIVKQDGINLGDHSGDSQETEDSLKSHDLMYSEVWKHVAPGSYQPELQEFSSGGRNFAAVQLFFWDFTPEQADHYKLCILYDVEDRSHNKAFLFRSSQGLDTGQYQTFTLGKVTLSEKTETLKMDEIEFECVVHDNLELTEFRESIFVASFMKKSDDPTKGRSYNVMTMLDTNDWTLPEMLIGESKIGQYISADYADKVFTISELPSWSELRSY